MERTALVKGEPVRIGSFYVNFKPIGLCADFDVVLYEGFYYRDMDAIATYSIASKINTIYCVFPLDNHTMLCYHMFVIDSMRVSW